jgi:hypothetical protein
MPSWRDKAHGGVLCTSEHHQQLDFPRSSQLSSFRPEQAVQSWTWTYIDLPFHHKTNLTRLCQSPPASQAASVLGHLSCVRPHWSSERNHGSTRVLSLPDVAHDIWLSTYTVYFTTAAGNSISSQLGIPVRATGTVRKRQAVLPSITYNITPAGSLPSSQPGGPPCWTSPLAFDLIVGQNQRL